MEGHYSDENENKIIQRILAGERDAFALIVDRYKEAIFNLAYRMTGNYDDANDLSQEAFFRAYRKLGYYKTDHKFFTWLYTISLNLIRNHLRKRKFEKLLQWGAETHDNAAVNDSPGSSEQELIMGEDAARLNKHLLTLPPGIREALVLRYFQNLSFEEIAVIAGISLSAAKMRVYRGIEKLHGLLRG